MNIIQGLENQFATKGRNAGAEKYEEIAVEYLQKLDFNDEDVLEQAVNYIKHILTDFVEQNNPITKLEAKIIHCMITKIILANLGLDNIRINYRNKTLDDRNAGAYYNRVEKSLNFFNDEVCNAEYFLNPYGTNQEKGANSRLDYFIRQIFVAGHECEHVGQFKDIENQDIENLTPEVYIMTQQMVARDFAMAEGTKYYDENKYIDRLYEDNHDQFYYEIDADKVGIEIMLDLLGKISPLAYQIATDEKKNNYIRNLSIKTEELKRYGEDITWRHDTNPNNRQVLATHKSSIIIGAILPKLSTKQRKEYFERYPSLAIVYNTDGSRKTLEQVESEKQEKINQILINSADNEVQERVSYISSIYDTAIEGDAVLCFEKCIQHIVRLTWHSDRYFTDNGEEVRYNPATIRRELDAATKKAILIAGYIEDVDAVKIKAIFTKYKRERNDKITNLVSQRFYEDKIRALSKIEQEFYNNKEAKQTIRRDEEEFRAQQQRNQMKQDNAAEIVQTLFPGFTPNPYTYIVNGDQPLSNVYEFLMLMEAYQQYVRTVTTHSDDIRNQEDFIRPGELYRAIKVLYNFETTPEQVAQFQKDLKEGKIKIVSNRYIPMAEQLNTQRENCGATEQSKFETKNVRTQTRTQQTSTNYNNSTEQHNNFGI